MNWQRASTDIMNDKVYIKLVLSHYEKHGRHDLSWRKRITAYRILVSEIMLQQTQVSRVIPKFELWMKQFPTLASLRNASLTDVLILWQGLGYQRRAKALLRIAQHMRSLPRTYSELMALPGIGPYTASALCAFAYDIFPTHLLETNIRTALIEAFHQGETDIHDGVLYDDLARLAAYPQVRSLGARTWYYALMDYGAHLKTLRISHNAKSAHHTVQSPYEGSTRQLRAKTLFAITHNKPLPNDERIEGVLHQLLKEGYIVKKGKTFHIS
jgi:A/G-specific adenine glycosylase